MSSSLLFYKTIGYVGEDFQRLHWHIGNVKIIGLGGGGHPSDTPRLNPWGTVATSVYPADNGLLSHENGEKSSPSVKKNDNLAPATYTPDEENALLFQLSDELILEDAAQYSSWQEWQQASEAEGIGNISNGSDTIQGSIPDDVIGWEREEWYEETWNRAHERRREKAAGVLKNKPRELTGNVLVVNSPFIGLNAGRYQVELDFFLELTATVPYRVF